MDDNVRAELENFDVDQLKQELQVRGSAQAADADATATRSTAGGEEGARGADGALARFSSRDIASALMSKQKVIYGTDDRQDLFEVTDAAMLADAETVVSLFRASRILDNGDGTSTLQVGKFGQLNSLCQEERFFDQPAGAFCSGFLVAPDMIATAGHCVDENDITSIRFVFGFRMNDATSPQVRISNEDIYAGTAVIDRRLTNDGTDWCLVRLDRSVTNGRIAALRRAGSIADNQAVHVIGHPSGLPLKVAGGANVRDNSPSAFFVANLDTYGGNSGSPVFNSDTHEVEGILVRGDTDFIPVGFCLVSAVCPTTGCRGEDCTRVSEFVDLVPQAQ